MTQDGCSVAGCTNRHYARTLCNKHYLRQWKFGSTESQRPSALERFVEKIEFGECWEWRGARQPGGYGTFHAAGMTVYAHRWSYEMLVGPIPSGLEIDHLCRVRHCVRPEHLEPVTHRENDLRGMAPSLVLHREGRCARGHSLTDASNVYVRKDNGARQCLACNRMRGRK